MRFLLERVKKTGIPHCVSVSRYATEEALKRAPYIMQLSVDKDSLPERPSVPPIGATIARSKVTDTRRSPTKGTMRRHHNTMHSSWFRDEATEVVGRDHRSALSAYKLLLTNRLRPS